MKPSTKKGVGKFILIAAIIVALVLLLGDLSKSMNPESFSKVWIISINGKQHLLLSSSQSYPGKSSSTGHIVRIIDPLTGKVIYHRSIKQSNWKSVQYVFFTSRSIWAQIRDNWYCYAFPSFKKKLNPKQFKKELLVKFPDIGSIHSIKYFNESSLFQVENTVGEIFKFSPTVFDNETESGIDLPIDKVVNLDYFPQMGEYGKYEVPHKMYIEGVTITIENVDDKKEVNIDQDLTFVEMLDKDTGFAKYYAVFTPDTTCLLMDGNKRRTMQLLYKDSTGIHHENMLQGKIWLNGDFLRPIKLGTDVPNNRCVTVYKDMVFIYWHTSLEKKDDQVKLTAVDYKSSVEQWTMDLSKIKLNGNYRPTQNYMMGSLLVTVWCYGSIYKITGIDLDRGEVIWKYKP